MESLAPNQARRFLLFAIGVGTVMRILWASAAGGHPFDIESYQLVSSALRDHALDVYHVTALPDTNRWPYPPGYFPWLAAIGGGNVRALAPLPAILADGALAWLVWIGLGRLGVSDERRLLSGMAVVIGPSFIFASAQHGQFDAFAILPAVAGLLIWERETRHRALAAGLLIGLGACLKTAPGLMLLALIPTATRRERVTLIGSAAAVAGLPLLPFLLAHPADVVEALSYSGVPGLGGLTMLVQPELAKPFLLAEQFDVRAGGLVRFMEAHGVLITGPCLLAAAAFAFRLRLAPREAAVLLWLAFLVSQTSFAFQYAVWALPFLLISGRLLGGISLQLALLVPAALYYFGEWEPDDTWRWILYVALMTGVWLGCATALAAQVRALRRRDA